MSIINAAQATQIAQNAQASQPGQASNQSGQAGQTGETTGDDTKSGGASTQFVGEEFNNFLKLLTAQLRHQDPLSPLDSTQFVEQLASFSTLEQQVQSNESLKSMASMIGDLHSMYASEWLGQTVTVESSWVPYSGQDVQYSVDAPEEATDGVLKIANSKGELVLEEPIDLSQERQSWNGRYSNGMNASSGEIYEFGIDLFSGDNYLGTVAPQVITKVTDVANENGTLRLGTSSSLTADLGQVRKVED